VGAQHLSIGGTGCQGSKHTVVTMVADEGTTSGLASLQQQSHHSTTQTPVVESPWGQLQPLPYITSECKSLWGEPERVHRISAVNIEDECTV